jgi:hypothetical protein
MAENAEPKNESAGKRSGKKLNVLTMNGSILHDQLAHSDRQIKSPRPRASGLKYKTPSFISLCGL